MDGGVGWVGGVADTNYLYPASWAWINMFLFFDYAFPFSPCNILSPEKTFTVYARLYSIANILTVFHIYNTSLRMGRDYI